MRKLSMLGLVVAVASAGLAEATIDAQGVATIVVQSSQEPDVYFQRTVPTEFCIGSLPDALARAITQPVVVAANYGCGGTGEDTAQVNAATCARVHAEEFDNHSSVRVRMDISGCDERARSANFKEALRNAVTNTFKSSGYKRVQVLN